MRCEKLNVMCLLKRLLAILSMTLFSATVSIQTAVAQAAKELDFQKGPGPYAFDCDAPGGHFQESSISSTGGEVIAAGKLRFLEVRSHPGWAASATVTFAGPERKKPFMGLQMIVMPNAPNYIQFAITGQGGAQDRSVFAVTPITDAWIPFEVKLSKSGQLEVSVAGQAERISVAALEPARLSLFCSTALVHFSAVTVHGSE